MSPKIELTPPTAAREVPAAAPQSDPPVKLTRQQLRALALDELAAAAPEAARALREAANREGKPPRGSTSREQTQRWLLGQVLDRIAEAETDPEGAEAAHREAMQVDELASRREAMKGILRGQRKYLNK